ncbi:hypothetical protein KAFR_0C05960 [Kazachstania africana CBS 2517]|uniref:Palmitoyltransferase n=1 Tax=Kazachstania africana (strain ATCC 22294 / BCRC 22015 / CBS 2517 / CECT 1963 / NBRC 1671 / NRRL Y-8276) TaxID=1071382 RepID=H2AT87_KAZAF|nr:hypothetical protein KAFR_0C05960 [Kazachstania africana CBS 2517]CCF57587.1 hypothetical protein KAFR_0C05960 [Kazachstania africana CBS 2517]
MVKIESFTSLKGGSMPDNSDNDCSVPQIGEYSNKYMEEYASACSSGNLPAVQQLIEGGKINIKEDYDEKNHITGLHWAASNNKLLVVDYLIRKGADVNIKDHNTGSTPIQWAARYGYVYIVAFLSKNGAKLDACDFNGSNLLHTAVISSNVMMVLYVLFFIVDKNHIKVDAQDSNGRTALYWAVTQGDSWTVEALIKYGASLSLPDNSGVNPLCVAIAKGYKKISSYILQHYDDYEFETEAYDSCLATAQRMRATDIFYSILSNNNYTTKGQRKKPISISVRRREFSIILCTYIMIWSSTYIFLQCTLFIGLLLSSMIAIFTVFFIQKTLIITSTSEASGRRCKSLVLSPFSLATFSSVLIAILTVGAAEMRDIWRPSLYYTITYLLGTLFVTYLLHYVYTSDPGNIPPEFSHDKIRQDMEDLLSLNNFDVSGFCLTTWVRRPFKSHISPLQKKRVAGFDHYCMWLYNDIALKNRKAFFYLLLALQILLYFHIFLCVSYFKSIQTAAWNSASILPFEALKQVLAENKKVLLSLIVATFQLLIVTNSFVCQLLTVLQGLTIQEAKMIKNFLYQETTDYQRYREYFNLRTESLIIYNTVNNLASATKIRPLKVIKLRERLPNKNARRRFLSLYNILNMCGWSTLVIPKRNKDKMNLLANEDIINPIYYGWKRNLADFFLTSDENSSLLCRLLHFNTTSKALLNGKETDFFTLYSLPSTRNHVSSATRLV